MRFDRRSTRIRLQFNLAIQWPIRYDRMPTCGLLHWSLSKQAVGGRPPRYAPASILPLWAPKRLAPPSRPLHLQTAAVAVYRLPRSIRSHAHRCQLDAAVNKVAWWPWPFDLESNVRVNCDVGYHCANSSLPRPLCSQLRPDERDRRQTASSLNAPAY